MAHLSDVLRNLLRRAGGDGSNAAGGPATGDGAGDFSTLYLLVRGERSGRSYDYYFHEYEVALWRSGALFVAEMRSRLRYRNSDHAIGRPWALRETFASLLEARQRAAEMLANPRQYGETNRDAGSHWTWSYATQGGEQTKETSRYERPAGLADGLLARGVAAGRSLPDGPAAGEVVRQLWGRAEGPARAAVRRFASEATPTYGHWSHWKWLYKQAEAASDMELLRVMIPRLDTALSDGTRDPSRAPFSWLEQMPRAATLAYMQRRARRFMRDLAARDPSAYVELAAGVLLDSGHRRDGVKRDNARSADLDPMHQWISFDILYGGSGRYIQTGHSRGRYVAQRSRPSASQPDERAPDAWTARGDLLLAIFTDPALPSQASEWAYVALTRRGIDLPTLDGDRLIRFLRGSSPLLLRLASQQVTAGLEVGQHPEPTALALAYYYGSGAIRRRIALYLSSPEAARLARSWQRQVALALSDVLVRGTRGARLSARQLAAALLLAGGYADLVKPEALTSLVPALVSAGYANLNRLARAIVERTNVQQAWSMAYAAGDLDEEPRRTLLDTVLARLIALSQGRGHGYYYYFERQAILDGRPWLRLFGWRVAAARTDLGAQQHVLLWDAVLNPAAPLPALMGAVASPDALRLLLTLPDQLAALTARLQAEPGLLSDLPSESFALLVRRFPFDVTLSLIPLMADDLWARLRGFLLDELRQDGRLDLFWRAVWARDADSALAARVAGDPVMATGFAEVAEPSYLETSNPAFEPLLLAWVEGRPDAFGRGARPLLTAALSKLPALRAWALRRIGEVGTTTPFALRLLESGLPETAAAGRRHFEAIAPGAADELDNALAILDSPDRAAQAYGRAYIASRRATLPAAELTRRLAEHPDPIMQELVAATLLENPAAVTADEAGRFDAAVLRGRDRGRRAKELIKRRLAAAELEGLKLDGAALLELARGQTERDRDWAMEQLARLAMAGESIDGLTLDGIGGI